MIEKTVLDYLNTALSGVAPCYMETPEEAPATYVLIEKTGGSKSEFISEATFAFQSYAPTLYKAAELNEVVKAAVEAMPDVSTEVTKATLNSDYNFTDPTKKQYRYQAVFDLVHY